MVVKPGYKQTEVGVIPEDWEDKTFGEIFTGFISGQTPSRSKPEFFKGNIPWITSGELNHGIVNDSLEKITEEAIQNSSIQIFPKGTFIFAIIGLDAEGTRGNCAVTGIDAAINQSCMALLSTGNVSINYLFYYYENLGNSLALRYCQGTKQQNYSGTIVRKLPIVFPKNPDEQQAITTALSNADARLSSLDKLIAKKRDIKQAAMQELLTGKRRLPGFDCDWKTIRLGEIAEIFKGKGLSKADLTPDGKRQCIQYGELFTLYQEKIVKIISRTNCEGKFVQSHPNDVLMPTSDVTPDGLATASCIRIPDIILGGDILIIRAPDSVMNGEFLAYVIRMDRNQILQLISGIAVFHIYRKDMAQFEFIAPPIEEQNAIATVLSDMDAELATLERKRDKTKAIKQGMMQELLTGRIRLT